jgi:hypothetical protein
MPDKILAACAVTAMLVLGFAYVKAGPGTTVTSSPAKNAQNPFPQPDTKSPEWRPLSDDLGIWIAKSDYVGMRGRLYVRMGDSWWPVAIDGAGDIKGVIPVR